MNSTRIVLVLLVCDVVGGWMVCGHDDNCICTDDSIKCRGVPGVEYTDRVGKTLEWDMSGEVIADSIDYAAVISGYSRVVVFNAPIQACDVGALRKYLENCEEGGYGPTTGSEFFTTEETTEETVMKGGSGLITAELSVTDRGIVIAIIINTAKISLVGYLLYQVLVSLVFIHSRLNQLEGREDDPQCVVRCTHSWMRCSYSCLRRVFCCCRGWFKVPDFRGKLKF